MPTRTGEPGQYSQDRTVSTEKPEKDSQDRAAMDWQERITITEQLEQDSHDRPDKHAARTGQTEQDSQDRTVTRGQPGQDSQNRTVRTGHSV
jgi:hypothetical protein